MMIKNIGKDKRGAALIYVIVAAAIIILLGAATTATAFVNLKSMQISEKSNTNFYSADAVMNMISSDGSMSPTPIPNTATFSAPGASGP